MSAIVRSSSLATLALGGVFVFATACSDGGHAATPDGGGSGGATATGGGAGMGGAGGFGGRGVYTAPACDPAASTLGKITTPSPLVSVGRPIKASACAQNAEKAVDGLYAHNGLIFQPAALPGWISISVAAGPTRLLLSWSDTGFANYTTVTGRPPIDYQILTSGDSTDGDTGTWTMVAEVTGNTVRNRAHSFDFTGKTWVKFVVTSGVKDTTGASSPVAIDEIELHDISAAATGPAADSWLFMGDSITAGAFVRNLGAGNSFDELIHTARPAFTPVMLNTGIGGELSGQGLAHVTEWLMLNPDFQHVAILYGTNDSWGDHPPTTFEANMTGIVDMLLAAGRLPVLARIPYSPVAPNTVPQYNDIIDRISTQKGLPCGPDLYGWFRDHPQEIDPNDAAAVHPNVVGYRSINRLWSEAMLGLYPAP